METPFTDSLVLREYMPLREKQTRPAGYICFSSQWLRHLLRDRLQFMSNVEEKSNGMQSSQERDTRWRITRGCGILAEHTRKTYLEVALIRSGDSVIIKDEIFHVFA